MSGESLRARVSSGSETSKREFFPIGLDPESCFLESSKWIRLWQNAESTVEATDEAFGVDLEAPNLG
jgi:hypothetical protein